MPTPELSAASPLDRREKEARRDFNAARAEWFLSYPEPDRSQVSAAVAHATLAAYYQARIEWEHRRPA